MKLRTTNWLITVSALVSVQGALSAPPIAFDGWSGSDNIQSGCPGGFSCSDEVSDTGMLQRTLTAGDGAQYIQLIVAGSDSQTGSQSSTESFIAVSGIGASSGGLSAKQLVFQNSNENIDAQTTINTGWADSGSEASIDMTLSNSYDYQGATITLAFVHRSDLDANGDTIGSYTGVDQTLTNTSQVTDSQVSGADQIRFATRRASGTRNTGGSLSIPGVVQGGDGMMGGGDGMMGQDGNFGDGMIGGGAGGNVSWSAGDDVQMSWIGQRCEGCVLQDDGMMGGGGGMGGGGMGGGGMGGGDMGLGGPDVLFSYQTFDNLSDGDSAIAGASISQTDPFDWDSNFGPQPNGP
jgi:hypothetical protein